MEDLLKWLAVLLMIVGFFAVSILPTVLAALWEKRLVWPYVPLDEVDERPAAAAATCETNPYAVGHAVKRQRAWAPNRATVRALETASREGFTSLGGFADGKGRLYNVRYEFWLSPDAAVLAIIGWGTVIGIPVDTIWFYTKLADGHVLVTLNNQHGSQFDLTGSKIEALVSGSDFNTLLDYHRKRVAAAPAPLVSYSKVDPLGDHRVLMSERVDRLHQNGLAYYLDPARAGWRYSAKGAVLVAIRMYANGMRRVFLPDRFVGWIQGRS